MKTILKYLLLGFLTLSGIAIFLALTGEQEGTLLTKILYKVGFAIALAVIILLGKVLYGNDYLPNTEDE